MSKKHDAMDKQQRAGHVSGRVSLSSEEEEESGNMVCILLVGCAPPGGQNGSARGLKTGG